MYRVSETITYTDFKDRPTKLNKEELEWFRSIVARSKAATECNVDIIVYDHDLYKGKSKNALGCCITNNTENPLRGDSYITIDAYFVHEQYDVTFRNGFSISGDTLEGVIAHEIAHLYCWRYGKKHNKITQELLNRIMEGNANDI